MVTSRLFALQGFSSYLKLAIDSVYRSHRTNEYLHHLSHILELEIKEKKTLKTIEPIILRVRFSNYGRWIKQKVWTNEPLRHEPVYAVIFF